MMNITANTSEQDVRVSILNSLLKTPHRDVRDLLSRHASWIGDDPLFYTHLAAWYAKNGEVRDHMEVFAATLITAQIAGSPELTRTCRDVGLALLRAMPPYQVARVVRTIKGATIKVREESSDSLSRRGYRNQVRMQSIKAGMFKNCPRSLRTEVARYLAEIEANPMRFDRAVLSSRADLHYLYETLHIAPGPRAQAILFDNNPPEGSLPLMVKQLAAAPSIEEKALQIAQHRIPYRVATSVLTAQESKSPTILAALVSVMTPQDVINNLASLKERGVSKQDTPEIWGLLEAALKAAKSDKRVSALKTQVAAEAAGADSELEDSLSEIREARLQAKGRITRPTAFFVDKSGSMDVAIEVARQLMAMALAVTDPDVAVYAYAFDSVPYPIPVSAGASLQEIERNMAGISARGRTACGAPLKWMARQGQRVEQLVFITDEDETTAPYFADAYTEYANMVGARPSVIIVKVGYCTDTLEDACQQMGVDCTAFEFNGDYYALPNVIPLLTRPSLFDLVMDILSFPLPDRKQGGKHG